MKKTNKSKLSDTLTFPEEMLENAFPGGFSIRDEANALTAYAFRNGKLEDLHAGIESALLDDPTLSRISDEEMKMLMIEASEKLESMLRLRETSPAEYKQMLQGFGLLYCRNWIR